MKLQMVNVTRKFGNFRAVENLNLTIENGVYGLLGVNGAGKTTLMRMICTLLPPTSGQILCDGKDIFKMDGEYRNLLGYLPQEFGFYPDFTVKDYLLYIASLKGIRPMVAGKRVKDLLAQVGLTKSANKKMKKLSGGMKRRAGIAQAMLNNPKILILDEPTAGLDPTERVRFRNLISELSEDRIVILSTHIVSDVEYIANEIWLMKDGQIMQQGNLDQTLASMQEKVYYILENRELIGQRELLQLSMETANNRIEISKINSDMISIEKQISDVVEGLKDVVTKSELADMMNSFISDDDEKWLMYNAKFSSADEVYASIYRQAKVSIYVVDNYIGLRTLVHLKNSQSGVSIILFSDNVGNNKLHNIEFTDFCKEYPNVKISMQKTGEIFHDRFIVLDYGTADERVFLCGASSKDAGARITSIVEDYGTKKYASVMATLLQNPPLVLPK